jgi:MATE family multidrug resistance protein
VGVADSVMVGTLGGIPLASVTIAFSIYIPFLMLGIGLSYGISPLVSKADGENDKDKISSILKHSIILNGLAGLFLFAIMYYSSGIFWKFRQPEEVVRLAIPFFEILSISIVPLMVFQTFRQFSEGLAYTKQVMYISIAGNVINIILNYLLIHGKWGLPELGVDGAGYATLISRIFMAIGMFAFVYYNRKFTVYWKNFSKIAYSAKEYFRLLKMSIPVGLQLCLESGAFGFAALMVGWLGSNELAAHQVALNLAAISYMTATGIASAATVRVGHEFGRKDFISLRNAGISSFLIVLMFMSMCALIFILFRGYLPHFYIHDEEIEKIAASLLLITAYFQLSDGFQVVGLGTLRGIGDVRTPTAIALVAYWLIGLPVGYVLAFHLGMGVEGIWYGLLIGLTIAAVLLLIRFISKSNELNFNIKPKEVSDYNRSF